MASIALENGLPNDGGWVLVGPIKVRLGKCAAVGLFGRGVSIVHSVRSFLLNKGRPTLTFQSSILIEVILPRGLNDLVDRKSRNVASENGQADQKFNNAGSKHCAGSLLL